MSYLAVSKQELRKAVKEFNSPSPQLEGPGRALDLGLEEDPDISVEFVNGSFYQASSGGSLVAIIADYPRLLPVSHVSSVGVPTFRKDSFVLMYLMKRQSGHHAEPAGASQQEAPRQGRLKRKAVRTETQAQRYSLNLPRSLFGLFVGA